MDYVMHSHFTIHNGFIVNRSGGRSTMNGMSTYRTKSIIDAAPALFTHILNQGAPQIKLYSGVMWCNVLGA